jgi:hypothetical protein
MSKHTRKQIIRALDLTFTKVANDLFFQMNDYPLLKRLRLAFWLALGRLPKL